MIARYTVLADSVLLELHGVSAELDSVLSQIELVSCFVSVPPGDEKQQLALIRGWQKTMADKGEQVFVYKEGSMIELTVFRRDIALLNNYQQQCEQFVDDELDDRELT